MGIEGIRKSAAALRYWELKQRVLANNLANVATPGFKGERVFARIAEDVGLYADSARDQRAGSLARTGRALDFALRGDGFLVVEDPGGERLVRGGSFQLDASGRVVDGHGSPLLGESGDIVLPQGEVSVDESGQVSVDGEPVARLRVVRAGDPDALVPSERAGFNAPQGEVRLTDPGDVDVVQGAVEDSNVDSVGALVDLIAVQRGYAAVQKSIQTLDSVLHTATSEIGRPVG